VGNGLCCGGEGGSQGVGEVWEVWGRYVYRYVYVTYCVRQASNCVATLQAGKSTSPTTLLAVPVNRKDYEVDDTKTRVQFIYTITHSYTPTEHIFCNHIVKANSLAKIKKKFEQCFSKRKIMNFFI
jgi:hypothetical protein